MKKILIFVALIFMTSITANALDMALYVGRSNDGWYNPAQVRPDGEKIAKGVRGFKDIQLFEDKDDLKKLQNWAEKNLKDGELDIIWLNGCMPSTLYPNPNAKPNGSLAQQWLENGNMFINVADWFAYCTYETGARGADNGAAGAENILKLPGIIRSADNTQLAVTNAGKKYLPSLGANVATWRPVVGGVVKTPWEVAEVFAGQEGGDMDPCVLYNTDTDSYMVFLRQSALPADMNRAQNTIEFINNWLPTRVKFSVEQKGKLTKVWGGIKSK